MRLRKEEKHSYGDSHLDIQNELLHYSKETEYSTTYYADAVCLCSSKAFRLLLDPEFAVAVRICIHCKAKHLIGESLYSEEYLDYAQAKECECLCGSGAFEITAGVALRENSGDVGWLYIGCRCINCGLIACYGDWEIVSQHWHDKPSHFREFLKHV
jgi:hypothetical protein